MTPVPSPPGRSFLESASLPKVIGIGFSYSSALPADLYRPELLDFVEITPETLCRARRDGAMISLDLVPERLAQAQAACAELPVVVHGIALSIGSVRAWNRGYLDMLDRFQELWPFRWHSEHLNYQTIPRNGGGSVDM